MTRYVPEKGDFVVVSFDPQSGHEQRGRRPALVVSNTLFNQRTGLAFVCPVTNADRGFPFHVPVGGESPITGFIMAEQLKSINFRAGRSSGSAKLRTPCWMRFSRSWMRASISATRGCFRPSWVARPERAWWGCFRSAPRLEGDRGGSRSRLLDSTPPGHLDGRSEQSMLTVTGAPFVD